MTAEMSVVWGLGILTFLLFDLWLNMRNDHPTIGMLFFSAGLMVLNILNFIVYKVLTELSTLSSVNQIGTSMILIMLWLTAGVTIWILGRYLWDFLKAFIIFLYKLLGVKPPFRMVD